MKCPTHQNCVRRARAAAAAICLRKGLRWTPLRRRIFSLIWKKHRAVKAYQLLAEMGDAKPPTVYRTLDFLLENGLIHKLNSVNAYVGCAHPTRHRACYFLICSACGDIRECVNPKLFATVDKNAGRNRFLPRQTALEVLGECRDCLA